MDERGHSRTPECPVAAANKKALLVPNAMICAAAQRDQGAMRWLDSGEYSPIPDIQ
jgi:hypothetical protein